MLGIVCANEKCTCIRIQNAYKNVGEDSLVCRTQSIDIYTHISIHNAYENVGYDSWKCRTKSIDM